MAAASENNQPWLHGPVADWVFGYGLAYAVSIPLLLAWPWLGGPAAWPPEALYLLAILVSGPHYGATLLRVLEDRGDRARYRRVTVAATLFASAWLVVSLFDVRFGSLLVSAYVYWSPWHFGGQNYGLALMSLRRRGWAVDPLARRFLHASFVLSVVLTAVGLNTASIVSLQSLENAGRFPLVRILIDPTVSASLAALLALAWLAAVAGFVLRQRRTTPLSQLAPAIALIGCQASWFCVPAVLMVQGRAGALGLAFATAWISAAHAIQYLWITSYTARMGARSSETGRSGGSPYLLRATLAGSLYLILPGLLLTPAIGGGLAWETGLSALVVSAVNVHHFLLDGAIWKLRDGRVARVLLQGVSADVDAGRSLGSAGRWLGVAGAASLVFSLLYVYENSTAADPAASTLRLEQAARRLDRIGRGSPFLYVRIGERLREEGDLGASAAAFERSLALTPTGFAWAGLALTREQAGNLSGAGQAWREARALDRDHAGLLIEELRFEARRRGAAEPDAVARASLERMHRERPAAIAPARALARELRAEGDAAEAAALLERTIAVAPSHRRAGLVLDLSNLLTGRAPPEHSPTLSW